MRLRIAARRGSPPGEPRLVGLLYVAPALIAFLIFGILPFLQTVQISTWKWKGIGEPVDVGLDN
jgi:raffinose/stachyose/melibiose transport system permease protein